MSGSGPAAGGQDTNGVGMNSVHDGKYGAHHEQYGECGEQGRDK
jgi:hypothetical protein